MRRVGLPSSDEISGKNSFPAALPVTRRAHGERKACQLLSSPPFSIVLHGKKDQVTFPSASGVREELTGCRTSTSIPPSERSRSSSTLPLASKRLKNSPQFRTQSTVD
jgi:hypothetical protein